VKRTAHQELLRRVRELRDSMTAYYGAYAVLAEALDAPLLTCDGNLARSQGHRAAIELQQQPFNTVSSGPCREMAGVAWMTAFFIRNSHAAPTGGRNSLIRRDLPQQGDIFDSHRPLHPPANAGRSQPTSLRA
jgi:hypothetical protein